MEQICVRILDLEQDLVKYVSFAGIMPPVQVFTTSVNGNKATFVENSTNLLEFF